MEDQILDDTQENSLVKDIAIEIVKSVAITAGTYAALGGMLVIAAKIQEHRSKKNAPTPDTDSE